LTNRTLVGGIKEYAKGDWIAQSFGGEIGYSLFVWLANAGIIAKLPNGEPAVSGVPMVIVWGIAMAIGASWVLLKTRFGNWIFASGGDDNAARNVGVPVARVKIMLFMFTAVCATVFAACQVVDFGSADSQRGLLKEFEAIIAAVIGGALLTGGYGSVIGASLGALIFGVVQMGIFYTGVNTDWFRVFLGIMLLLAVIFNNYIRKIITGGR
jgi:simple sugar transport system permease protein